MASEFEPLDELAEAVLLGQNVDWESAESSAGAVNREAVRQLKVLARIAELHRNLAYDIPSAAPPKLERWGRLELLECIGRGSFGEVYRAWDSKLDREVAVKLLHADGAQPEGAAVLREARLLARVRHPNVVTVYDADEIEGRVGLWMEFIHGRNLEQILREREELDDREVMRIGIEVCRALAAVHDAGLLHRDIKAQNVVQTADGRLVLMDFGTGRELETPSRDVDTAGTPLYLAPELFDGGAATVRSDVYSAGVLLFHLLTGAYPVRGATVQEVHDSHSRGERVDLVSRVPGVTRTLSAVIARATQPDPSQRFESVREMLAGLENVQRKAEASKRKTYRLAFGAAALVAIVLAALPGMKRGDRDRPQGTPSEFFGVTPEKRAVQIPPVLFPGTPSPDGRYLPFSEFRTGNLGLYEFATGTSRILRDGGNGDDTLAVESIVSPDSSQVAYNWNDASCDCVQLRLIETTGASDRVLLSSLGATELVPLEWSHDGTEILGRRKRESGETDIILISAADGSTRSIRTLPDAGSVSLSLDARYVAYDRPGAVKESERGIYVSAIDDNNASVAIASMSDSHPMWTPDGSGLVFMSTRTGGLGLWLQPIKEGRPDGQPLLLEKDMGPFDPITLTRRGSLFYRQRTGLMDVYTVPIDRTTGDIRDEPTVAATRHVGSNLASDWSPDGSTLAFASWRTSGQNVLVFHSMETGADRELELDLGVVNTPRWSPDGRVIAVGGYDRQRVAALRLIEPQSGRILSTLFARSGEMPPLSSAAWDPDGRHLYLRRNSRPEISRFDMSTGEEESVYEPPPASFLGRISMSPNGRWLLSTLYRRPEKAFRLIVVPTGGGASRSLVTVPEPAELELGDWMPDGKQVLFVRVTRDEEQKKHGEVFIVPFEGGSPRSLGISRLALRELRVSPTGDYISFTAGFPDKEIWVFENFLPTTSAP